jgi:hypothetical protein
MGNALKASFSLYRSMFGDDIMFMYKGQVTSDLVSHVLEIMEDRLQDDRNDRRFSKKIYNVMVECLTNLYADESQREVAGFDPTALLTVKKIDSNYILSTGTYIPATRADAIKTVLDRINESDNDALKAYHKEVLLTEAADLTGITDLGLIDLARKSKNKLNYEFEDNNGSSVFFALETTITHGSV